MCFRPIILKCIFDPMVWLSGKQITCVSSHKYLGHLYYKYSERCRKYSTPNEEQEI